MQGAVEFFGNGGFEADLLLGSGMDKGQHLGMQAEAIHRTIVEAMTILTVAHYGMTHRSEMHADLVGAAGLEVELKKGYGGWVMGYG